MCLTDIQIAELNLPIDFAATVVLPLMILTIFTDFSDQLAGLIDSWYISQLERENLDELTRLHTELKNITNYVIRYSERMLSIDPTDPYMGVEIMNNRYQNLLELHRLVENIHELTRRLILDLDIRADYFRRRGLVNFAQAHQVLANDFNRVALSHNTLIHVLGYIENYLVEQNPAFQRFICEWFRQ